MSHDCLAPVLGTLCHINHRGFRDWIRLKLNRLDRLVDLLKGPLLLYAAIRIFFLRLVPAGHVAEVVITSDPLDLFSPHERGESGQEDLLVANDLDNVHVLIDLASPLAEHSLEHVLPQAHTLHFATGHLSHQGFASADFIGFKLVLVSSLILLLFGDSSEALSALIHAFLLPAWLMLV